MAEIAHLNTQNLNDILRYIMFSMPVYTGTNGYSMDYLGNGRKGLKVLLNGLPIWQSSIDQIDLSRYPIYNLERIEILYGNTAVYYGSNANTAVINLITKSVDESLMRANVNANFSGKNEYNSRFEMDFNRGRHHATLTGGRYFFNGYQGTDSLRVFQWKPRLAHQLAGTYQFKLLHNLSAFVRVNYMNHHIQDRSYPIPNSLRVYDNEQVTNHLVTHFGITGKVSKYHTIDFSHSYTRFGLENRKTIKILSDLKSIDDPNIRPFDRLDYDEYFSQIKIARNNTQNKLDYETGFEFSHQRDRQHEVLEAVKTNITQIALMADFIYRPRKDLWLKSGLRYTHSNKFKTPLIFNGQLRYIMSPQATFLAQYARGFRSPTFNELFYTYENPELNIKGNLRLQSEIYQSINTSLIIQSDDVAFKTHMMWQSTQNGIQLLAVNLDEQVYQFLNNKSAKFISQTVSLETRKKYVNSRLIFSNNGLNQFPEEIGSYYFYQELAGIMLINLPRENMSLMYAVKYNGSRSEIRKNALGLLEDFSQSGFWMMDASMKFDLLDQKLNIALGIKNLVDVKNVAGKFLPFDRLSDNEINSKIPLSIDFGRRGWLSLTMSI